MLIKHFKPGQAIDHYAESKRESHTVIRPRNHDNSQGDRYLGDDILSRISIFCR